MKRLPSLLLSLVLSLALLVPVFAADACKQIRYTDFTCGKEMHFTEHYCRNGDKTIRVESADACAVSHLDASAHGRKHRRWQDEHCLVPLFTS